MSEIGNEIGTGIKAVRKTAVIVGVTADIGRGLAERLMSEGWSIVGIGRSIDCVLELQNSGAVKIYQCAITNNEEVSAMACELRTKRVQWDLLVSSVGTTEPIGRFFDLDFDEWEKSIGVNFLAQMRVLHALWPLRRRERTVDIMLLAGGGTNGAWCNYSAYCVSKIALIKMCELIDDEAPDANAFIIGPGYTRTRIHQETLRAGPAAAGKEYFKVKTYLEREGTTIEEIYEHMRWCMAQGRSVSGGRNFSTVHDPWRDGGRELANILRDNRDVFRLRRRSTNR
jgi:NAD(P)-dependent dehydrogenase (short-subunit alcohol dehydrogenase family)